MYVWDNVRQELLTQDSYGKCTSKKAFGVKTESRAMFSLKCTTKGRILHMTDLSAGRGGCEMFSRTMVECGFSGSSDNMKKGWR